MLDAIVPETGPNPNHAVIWMHGLGADGSDLCSGGAHASACFIGPLYLSSCANSTRHSKWRHADAGLV